jgi:NADH:ubiquinone oxidoreductase subunit D
MKFYEEICGARIHAAYIRPGGVSREGQRLSSKLVNEIYDFTSDFSNRLNDIETMLTHNRI